MQAKHSKEEGHITALKQALGADPLRGVESVIRVQTSGSTGAPKSVARSLRSWELSAEAEAALFGIGAQERFAVIGSSNHSLWAYVSYRSKLAGGEFLGLELGQRSAKGLMNDLLAFSPTVLYAVPDLLARLLSASPPMGRVPTLPGLGTLILGGGAWSPRVKDGIDAFAPRAKTWLFYGTAEASFIGYSSTADWPWYRPFPGVEVRVAAETGQLSVCSPFTCLAPKGAELSGSTGEFDSAKVLVDRDLGQHAQASWLATSDCVEMDATQSDIRFRLVGRMERIIRLNGVDIAPEPIESLLAVHYSGSLFCVCLADHVGPARLGLFYCSEVELTDTARIRGLVKEAFPGLPVLSFIQRLDAWPRLASGKTDFQRLGDLTRGLR